MKIPRIPAQYPQAPHVVVPEAPMVQGSVPVRPMPSGNMPPQVPQRSALPIVASIFEGIQGIAIPLLKNLDEKMRMEAGEIANKYLVEAESYRVDMSAEKTISEYETREKEFDTIRQKYRENIKSPHILKYFDQLSSPIEAQSKLAMIDTKHKIKLNQNLETSMMQGIHSSDPNVQGANFLAQEIVQYGTKEFPIMVSDQVREKTNEVMARTTNNVNDTIKLLETYNANLTKYWRLPNDVSPEALKLTIGLDDYENSLESAIGILYRSTQSVYAVDNPKLKAEMEMFPERFQVYKDQTELRKTLVKQLQGYRLNKTAINKMGKKLEKSLSEDTVETKTVTESSTIDVHKYVTELGYEETWEELSFGDKSKVIDSIVSDLYSRQNIVMLGGLVGGGNQSLIEGAETWKQVLYAQYTNQEYGKIVDEAKAKGDGTYSDYFGVAAALYDREENEYIHAVDLTGQDRDKFQKSLTEMGKQQSSARENYYYEHINRINMHPEEVYNPATREFMHDGYAMSLERIYNDKYLTDEHRKMVAADYEQAYLNFFAEAKKVEATEKSQADTNEWNRRRRAQIEQLTRMEQDKSTTANIINYLNTVVRGMVYEYKSTGEEKALFTKTEIDDYIKTYSNREGTKQDAIAMNFADILINEYGLDQNSAIDTAGEYARNLPMNMRKQLESDINSGRDAFLKYADSSIAGFYENNYLNKLKEIETRIKGVRRAKGSDEDISAYLDIGKNIIQMASEGTLYRGNTDWLFENTPEGQRQKEKFNLIMGDEIEKLFEADRVGGGRSVIIGGESYLIPKTGEIVLEDGVPYYKINIGSRGKKRDIFLALSRDSASGQLKAIPLESTEKLKYAVVQYQNAYKDQRNPSTFDVLTKVDNKSYDPEKDRIKVVTDFTLKSQLRNYARKQNAEIGDFELLENGELWARRIKNGKSIWTMVEVDEKGYMQIVTDKNNKPIEMPFEVFRKITDWRY
jgi:hypothetical protein